MIDFKIINVSKLRILLLFLLILISMKAKAHIKEVDILNKGVAIKPYV
jgi:hypothetical protein